LTYRFVFLPETIGSISYLHLRGDHLKAKMVAGYQVTCVGLDHAFVYERSRRGDSDADRAALLALHQSYGDGFEIRSFRPNWGSDDRQYCSPGFNLPLGSIMRSSYDEYPEYHTSLDNRDLVSFPAIVEAIDLYELVMRSLDANGVYRNTRPHGEVQLGKLGLYPPMGNYQENLDQVAAMLWLLNLADGNSDLIAISERSGVDIRLLDHFAGVLKELGILDIVG